MSRREVSLPLLALLLLLGAVVVMGFPTPHEDDGNNSSGSRPLIEFTKGGIRVNFGGYHAQAGLGGLLTGRGADGGLHASAGIENGPHASAGLGGSLEGGPSGGLHARAGLGNGGPDAEAGLGGTLAGPKPQGEIFSRSSAGNLNLVLPQKTAGKNIQVIQPKRNDEQVSSSSSSSSASVGEEAAASTNDESAPKATEAKEPTTSTAKPSTPPAVKPNAPGVFTRAVAGVDAATGTGSSASNNIGYKKKTTLFDDIFNIPISALNAVNQLLRNHVGKK